MQPELYQVEALGLCHYKTGAETLRKFININHELENSHRGFMQGSLSKKDHNELFRLYYENMGNDAKLSIGTVEDATIPERARIESALFFYIKSGNLLRLRSFLDDRENLLSLFPRQLAKSILRMQLRSTEIVTRASIAASQNGISDELLYSILNSHADNLESCYDPEKIPGLTVRCLYEFAFLTVGILTHKSNDYSPLVNKSIEYILKRLPEKISLSDISKELHVTPKYISTLFNRDTGTSISDFMQNIRIEEAKHMLLYTDLNYPDISNILCFGSQSYFNQVFRKKTGMTPREFRISAGSFSP